MFEIGMGYRDKLGIITSNWKYSLCISRPILSLTWDPRPEQLLPAGARRRGGNQVNAFLSFKDFNMIFVSGFTKGLYKMGFVAEKNVSACGAVSRSIITL